MSETTNLDLKEQASRIDRMIAETQKFMEETLKLTREARKYDEEAQKLRRDRGLAPWLAFVAISGGVGGTIAGITAILHLLGKVP
jgi:hypothetical protein